MRHAEYRFAAVLALGALATGMWGQALSPQIKAGAEARAKQLQALGTDPNVVAAVKAYNASPSAEAKAMTNEKWKKLSILDPFVRSLSKSPLGEYLKTKKDASIAECFVSGADGGKVAFLSKTSSWSHKGKDKHSVPMTGRIYYGPLEVDESSGAQVVQIGLPVMDGGKPIGSILVSLVAARLK